MPTLFRLLATIAALVGLAYAGLFAMATYLAPTPRPIEQAVALPQDAGLKTGRSAARDLDAQARRLVGAPRDPRHPAR